MAISYKNFGIKEILNKYRNIAYASFAMYFGFQNTIEQEFELVIDIDQISQQADIFAREMMANRSLFDFKRFLGSFQEDWTRLLHEAYVYDRLFTIYYGLNSNNIMDFPENSFSFPGNVLLLNLLTKNSFRYSTNDSQPFSLFVKINVPSGTIEEFFQQIFDIYPDLRNGMSTNPRVVSYMNARYESILRGLYYGKQYLIGKNRNGKGKSRSQNHDFYEMVKTNDEKIANMISDDSNPLMNSFLNKLGNKFYFLMPIENSVPSALRYNESVFISRGIGFRSTQVVQFENPFYNVVDRQITGDPFTREELYSITGIKTEMVPYTMEEIINYLGIKPGDPNLEHLNIKWKGGTSSSTP